MSAKPQAQSKGLTKAQQRAKERSSHVLKCIGQLTHPLTTYVDIGCGNAEITCQIANDVGATDVYGIDVYPKSAFVQPQWSSVNVNYIENNSNQASPLSLFPDRSVDLITGFELFHHVINPKEFQALMKDIKRVLKVNGLLFFREHDVDSSTPQGKLMGDQITAYHEQFDDWVKGTPINYFSRVQLQKILTNSGLKWKANSFYPRSKPNPQGIYHSMFINL